VTEQQCKIVNEEQCEDLEEEQCRYIGYTIIIYSTIPTVQPGGRTAG
jgi:hypothetical protein